MNKIQAALAEQWARPVADRVVIDLPLPISTNALHSVGRGNVRRSDENLAWRKEAGLRINMQRAGRIDGPYVLTVFVSRKSGNDLDNCGKLVSDILQANHVIENDRSAEEINYRWSDEVDGCRAVVDRFCSAPARGGLTKRQHDVLAFLRSFVAAHGYAPSYDEIKDAVGLRSKSGIERIVTALVERGFIERLPERARSIKLIEAHP